MARQLTSEFEFDGNRYQIGVMDVFTQMEVATKLSPLIFPFAQIVMTDDTMAKLQESGTENRKQIVSLLFDNIGKITDLLRSLSKEDIRAVMEGCFSCVTRNTPGSVGWQPIWNPAMGRLQFDDLNSLPAAMTICGNVIGAKLKDFFPDALS